MRLCDNPVFRREMRRSVPARRWARWMFLASFAFFIVAVIAIGVVVMREIGPRERWQPGAIIGGVLYLLSTIMTAMLVAEGHGRYLKGSGGEQVRITLMRPSEVIEGIVGTIWFCWALIFSAALPIWIIGVATSEACLTAVAWGFLTVSNVHVTSSLIIRGALDEETGELSRRRMDLCLVQSVVLDFALVGLVLKPIALIRHMTRSIPESPSAGLGSPEHMRA